MFVYLICMGLGLLNATLQADQRMPDVEQNKRRMADKAVQNVNMVFDAILEELDETQRMHTQLRSNFLSLERENEELHTIKAELAMAQKDLQKALDSEAAAQQKLARLHQQAGKEISLIKDEFESFKARLETTTNNFDKVFW